MSEFLLCTEDLALEGVELSERGQGPMSRVLLEGTFQGLCALLDPVGSEVDSSQTDKCTCFITALHLVATRQGLLGSGQVALKADLGFVDQQQPVFDDGLGIPRALGTAVAQQR